MHPNPENAPAQDRQNTERAADLHQSAQVYALDGSPYVEPRASANTQSTTYSSGLLPLQIDEPPSTGDDMSDPTREEFREEVKDKIAAAEARTDTKVERLGAKIDVLTATIVGKIDSLSEKIDKSDRYNHDTRWWIISIFVVGVFSLAGLIVALNSFGDARFGLGMNIRDVVQTVIKEQQEFQKRDTTQQRH